MDWWRSLSRPAAWSFAGAAMAIVALVAAGGWWLLRTEQAVLFSEVRAQDAAVLTAELDKLKIPYALGDAGSSILVDAAQVHAVRLKLMGKDLPLHGSVGFELFNQTDFGMTEFAQKINYQRALQGELTRTVLSLQEVRDARVHLALPEQGLFRQASARPKAAITLSLRQGASLRPEQVNGIQRLIAAAVPGLLAAEVTIVDERGLALTRSADAAAEGTTGSARLELKRETEAYLARKVDAVLERAFGPGQALSSVDVTLNMDQVRVTTEDVIAAPDGKGGPAAGVLVRERESARDAATADPRGNAGGPKGSSMQRDVEYQAGRRVEHVVSQPGAIRRLQVVAVIRQPLGEAQRQQLERLVAAAAGASVDRGDAIVVQSLQVPAASLGADVASPSPSPVIPAMPAVQPARAFGWAPWAVALPLLVVLAWLHSRRTRRARAVAPLSPEQRQLTLERVQGWLTEPTRAGVGTEVHE